MTLSAFRQWLTAIDPAATQYHAATAGSCTVWAEYKRIPAYADGVNQGGWKVQIDRYTTQDDDPVAERIAEAIETSETIAAEHIVDYDADTGLIRHLFDCEVW